MPILTQKNAIKSTKISFLTTKKISNIKTTKKFTTKLLIKTTTLNKNYKNITLYKDPKFVNYNTNEHQKTKHQNKPNFSILSVTVSPIIITLFFNIVFLLYKILIQ